MTISEKMPKESAREYAMRIVKENIVSLACTREPRQ